MPQTGEIRQTCDIEGYSKNRREKCIWHACINCGRERWVVLLKGEPRSYKCHLCGNQRLLPKPKGTIEAPEIGDIRHSSELGYIRNRPNRKGSNIGYKLIWQACVICGKERWVPLYGNKLTSDRCQFCAVKTGYIKDTTKPRKRVEYHLLPQDYIPQIGEIRHAKELEYKKHYAQYIYINCIDCGKARWSVVKDGVAQYPRCASCAARLNGKSISGKSHPAWRGGRTRDGGYTLIKLDPSNFFYPMVDNGGYIREHRLVMAQRLGRCLQSWECVHHKNGVKTDNKPENLELTTHGSHILSHSRGYKHGYQRGLIDGRLKQIQELKEKVRILVGDRSPG